MKNRVMILSMVGVMLFSGQPQAYAAGGREAAASFLLPTRGQAMNNEAHETKTKVMAGLEVVAVSTAVILGIGTGGASVLFGVVPMLANRVWSSTDAYQVAQAKAYQQEGYQQGTAYHPHTADAQRTLEMSRQSRFEREQHLRGSLHDRVQQAGEMAYHS